MTDHFDWDRLARYVSGESGALERAEIERWAASSDANRKMLESVRRRWTLAGDGASWNVDSAWSRLAPRLRDVAPEPGIVDINVRRTGKSPWFTAGRLVPLAAAAVLLVAVAVKMTSTDAPTGGTLALTGMEMRTGVGEQRTIDLSDGSQVVLGATSTLRLGSGFGESTREVFLEGQAFLRVRHDAARPFVVNAGGTRAIDLGTAFEVRAYPNEGVRVAVTEGMVEVRRDAGVQDSAVLQPGDIAEVPPTGATVVKRQQNVERLLGWTRGELVFDDAPLSDVGRDLERWFDVQVRIDDAALRSRHLTTSLRIGDSLDAILEVIETTLSVRVERDGNVLTIRSGPPRPTVAPPGARGRVEAGA
jgi:ferric-dicitrate binding protein FerR (iron transport regulator)